MFRKLLNEELHRISKEEYKEASKTPLVIILDNVRSQHNIGSTFRTADAFRIEKIILCGICATPPTAEIHKSALGAEFSVDWEYYSDTIEAINAAKNQGYQIVGIEQTENSISLDKWEGEREEKYALIFGNEVYGVKQEAIDLCDACIEIPQFGTKHSLNISVSVGVVLWDFIRKSIK